MSAHRPRGTLSDAADAAYPSTGNRPRRKPGDQANDRARRAAAGRTRRCGLAGNRRQERRHDHSRVQERPHGPRSHRARRRELPAQRDARLLERARAARRGGPARGGRPAGPAGRHRACRCAGAGRLAGATRTTRRAWPCRRARCGLPRRARGERLHDVCRGCRHRRHRPDAGEHGRPALRSRGWAAAASAAASAARSFGAGDQRGRLRPGRSGHRWLRGDREHRRHDSDTRRDRARARERGRRRRVRQQGVDGHPRIRCLPRRRHRRRRTGRPTAWRS